LEYARDGRVELQQNKNFDSLLVRRARPKAAVADHAASESGTE
jgi:chromatin segregation and condensation protein Rec8/ScpA/Scc1 (kleisin family)